jgi:hypothetical protein
MTLKSAQYEQRNVDTFAPVPRRRFYLRIDTRWTATGLSKALDHVEFFIEGHDTETTARRRKTLRKYRGTVGVPTLVHVERPQFRQAEVPDVVSSIVTTARRKSCPDIGNPIEMYIVQYDEFIVCRGDDILLEEIGAHAECQGFRLQRVLG